MNEQETDNINRLEEELKRARRQENQLRDYIAALERKLTYRETLAILEAKQDCWPWALGRADYNRRLSALLDPRD